MQEPYISYSMHPSLPCSQDLSVGRHRKDWNSPITLFSLKLTTHRCARLHYWRDSYGVLHGVEFVEPRNSSPGGLIDIPRD